MGLCVLFVTYRVELCAVLFPCVFNVIVFSLCFWCVVSGVCVCVCVLSCVVCALCSVVFGNVRVFV